MGSPKSNEIYFKRELGPNKMGSIFCTLGLVPCNCEWALRVILRNWTFFAWWVKKNVVQFKFNVNVDGCRIKWKGELIFMFEKIYIVTINKNNKETISICRVNSQTLLLWSVSVSVTWIFPTNCWVKSSLPIFEDKIYGKVKLLQRDHLRLI